MALSSIFVRARCPKGATSSLRACFRLSRRLLFLAAVAGLFLVGSPLRAQIVPVSGFQVSRYQPTAAGEWSFWVDHPWYSSTRRLSAGVTLDYGHNPLVVGLVNPDGSGFARSDVVISHQLIGHLDFAVSFADRVNFAVTLPVTFVETGTEKPIGNVLPQGAGVGDPRLGAMFRVAGQSDAEPLSLHLGAQVWVPLHEEGNPRLSTRSDQGFRFLPKLVLAGYGHYVRWSFTGGVLYRTQAQLGSLGALGSTAGSELQLGASIYYANKERRFAVGPEAVLATLIAPNYAFKQNATSVELLLGAHYHLGEKVMLSAGGGVGILQQLGTPDGRFLLRASYAPLAKSATDFDKDGVSDDQDECPQAPAGAHPDPQRKGCPLGDRDNDGVFDNQDLCADTPAGDHPDPERRGCPLGDQDGDGVFDNEDRCPSTPAGDHPDLQRPGCALGDRDGDGVFDNQDQCPDTPAGAHPNPQKKGCPATDRDQDGVFDYEDQCPETPAGHKPDAQRPGCPQPDRDGDSVVDSEDACPNQPGAPSADLKKNGCPGRVEIRQGQVRIIEQVFFATKKDAILPKSFALLVEVADAIKASPQLKRVEVQGHTDNKGRPEFNLDLSQRRAQSVVHFLVEKGVAAERLVAKGYGPARPITDNKTNQGRAQNRRVQFVILEPPQAQGAAAPPAPPPVVQAVPLAAKSAPASKTQPAQGGAAKKQKSSSPKPRRSTRGQAAPPSGPKE